MDSPSGVSVAYIGIMQALSRTVDADRSRDQVTAAISAAESMLWMRSLLEVQHIGSGGFASESECGIFKALKVAANKAIHEQIHPHSETVKFNFLSTRIVFAPFEFEWKPFDEWKHLVTGNKISEPQSKAYQLHLSDRPVVVTLSRAVALLCTLVPPDHEASRSAVAVLDEPNARGRYY